MTHKYLHGSHDECAHHHTSSHTDSHQHDDIDQDGKDAPVHHHDCCHFPSADRTVTATLTYSFHSRLMEIIFERALSPEEPFFVLDKPPLI